MRAPKGISARRANLKHCVPNGMPTIVIHQISPNTQEMTANSHPKTRIQRTFRRKLVVQFANITFLPNGQITREVNLKHWIPVGMPIIVQQQKRPAIAQRTARIPPPNKTHSMFPKTLISCYHHFTFFFLGRPISISAHLHRPNYIFPDEASNPRLAPPDMYMRFLKC